MREVMVEVGGGGGGCDIDCHICCKYFFEIAPADVRGAAAPGLVAAIKIAADDDTRVWRCAYERCDVIVQQVGLRSFV